MSTNRCIFVCDLRALETPQLHRIPKNEPRRTEWLTQLPTEVKVTTNSRLCRYHFAENDYENGKLRKDAIPSLNLILRKRKKKANPCCIICGDNNYSDEDLSYYDFPNDVVAREEWRIYFNLPSSIDLSTAVLCNLHFKIVDGKQQLGSPTCFSQRKKFKRNPKTCHYKCVICNNNSAEESYHCFPNQNKQQTLFNAWLKASGVVEYQFGMKVCGRHFLSSDFSNLNNDARKLRLKKNTVPSSFLENYNSESDETISITNDHLVDIQTYKIDSSFQIDSPIQQTVDIVDKGLSHIQQEIEEIPNVLQSKEKEKRLQTLLREEGLYYIQQEIEEIPNVSQSEDIITRLQTLLQEKDKRIEELQDAVNACQNGYSLTPSNRTSALANISKSNLTSSPVPTASMNTFSSSTATPQRARSQISCTNLLYRFPGDIRTPHVVSPQRAKRAVRFLQNCISTGQIENKKLRRKVSVMEKKIRTLKGIINCLYKNVLLSPVLCEKSFVSPNCNSIE